MIFPCTYIDRLNLWRPYVYVRVVNTAAGRKTNLVPMVLDTGADYCLFNANLAHAVGINPAHGGAISGTTGVGGSTPTALFPVELMVPDMNHKISIHAQFGQLPAGINGLLGNHGFLDHFERVAFHPQRHEFELVLAPTT